MAKRKKLFYSYPDIFRQDKLDDYIFAYFTGVRDCITTIKLQEVAMMFQKNFGMEEYDLAVDIIMASYHRSLEKYNNYIQIREYEFFNVNKSVNERG